VRLERIGGGIEPAFDHRPHEVETTARRVRLVAQTHVGGAGWEAKAAVDARKQTLALGIDGRGERRGRAAPGTAG
jgi:hypothetical protein